MYPARMPDDPHRDALGAALARLEALEQENRALREGSGAGAVPVVPTMPTAPIALAPVMSSDVVVEHAIDDTLRHLSERLDRASPVKPAELDEARVVGKPTVPCAACGSRRTVEAPFARGGGIIVEHRLMGDHKLDVARARACADCGHVTLLLDSGARAWLDTHYLSTLLAQGDK